ncbi:phosphomannomutase [Candidatus Berkelbacteria bacterium CG10_big_fil_rev_8_21_14_0_10_43_13]|uniref:Phosphomannomutase n=1 Tax=Candidatus Berkelbacteria bacterium CG10_big_fil_rev_8_21_14_0_10_43_13 TaxID=1974514 RepID=A0A2H0W5K9_9BACT|nr:MAG: phosphomannomutase [Candidatus Berkelbacteria bacterium CG10_big_fil_rev_8_21_14_0_10_43_13]
MSEVDKSIFKAYDIRGVYPESINEDLAYKIAQGYVEIIKPEGKVAVGYDVRNSSPALHAEVVRGLTDAGVDVVDIGLISTEMLYFAVGQYGYAGGITVTASHNPKEYGGMKMVKEKAMPITGETGIMEISDFCVEGRSIEADKKGSVEKKDIMTDFANFTVKFVDTSKIKPTKLTINPNFGFEGVVLKAVIKAGNLPIEVVGINDTPDGNFPKGRPDPFLPENRPEFIETVKSSGSDLGVAWDADADRVFFCTSSGKFVEPYYTNAALIAYMLKKDPGATIIYDPRYTWALIDSAEQNGGKAEICRVGHSFIKLAMRKSNAFFSGESSGHTYFRDFWFADSGILPLLEILEMLGATGKTLDEILAPYYAKYFISGEYNNKVADSQAVVNKIEEKYSDSEISKLDGLSIEYPDWRANIRSSNTEPLLRLNVEAKSEKLMEEKRDELLAMIIH